MTLSLSLLLAATPAPAAPSVLECGLVTPGGEPVAFAAEIREGGAGAVFLTPAPGTVWPAARLAGGGAVKQGKEGPSAAFHFAGTGKNGGLSLEVKGERATLYAMKGNRKDLPRAYGFCVPGSADAAGEGPVATDAKADIPAFDPANWPDHCGLITRQRQSTRIDYTIIDNMTRSEVRTNVPALFGGETRVEARRTQGARRSRFSGEQLVGYETLVVEEPSAVQLLEFERFGVAGPAAGICGISTIIRRAVIR
ncbi:MAG: hypothetical protein ACK40O_04100 [Allosphingosinicella sp.]